MSEGSGISFPGGTVLGHPGDWRGVGVKRGAIFPPSCRKDCGSSGSCPGPWRRRTANGPGAAGFVKISVLLKMMAKPCSRQEAYSPKICNTAYV